MPENREMLGKVLEKMELAAVKEMVVTIPAYDSKKVYKLYIKEVKRMGPDIKIKVKEEK